MKLKKIDCVMHYTNNINASVKFYTETLGLKVLWRDKNVNMTGLGMDETDTEIVLHNDTNIPQDNVHYLVDDVDKFCREYKSAGNKIYAEPFDIRCGKCAVISDNEGNGISILDLTKINL
jgi:predicted enzyme related to lactoylglutathione lyase